jgi:hypothetical protein
MVPVRGEPAWERHRHLRCLNRDWFVQSVVDDPSRCPPECALACALIGMCPRRSVELSIGNESGRCLAVSRVKVATPFRSALGTQPLAVN